MGWETVVTVLGIATVLLSAIVVAVYDHRRTHPGWLTGARVLESLTVNDPARVHAPPARAFPWARALHHEAIIMAAMMAGVVVLDHLVSGHAVPWALRAWHTHLPRWQGMGSSWVQGWALILGLQAVLVHALRQSVRDGRNALPHESRLDLVAHMTGYAFLLLVMATVGAWIR